MKRKTLKVIFIFEIAIFILLLILLPVYLDLIYNDLSVIEIEVKPNDKKEKYPIAPPHNGKINRIIIPELPTYDERYVPYGFGRVHPFMGWQMITDTSTLQYKLKQEAEGYDSDGMGKVGDRYAVAVKPYYGEIGDYIDVVQKDGVIYKCIIVEYKGDENKNSGWISNFVHRDDSVVEFVVDMYSFYNTGKTIYDCHPEWKKNIEVIRNVGNYWEDRNE